MTATAHALIGASIAARVTNPIIGIPLAILSHFLADLVPHWDAATNRRKKSVFRLRAEATADVLLGFALSFIIFRNAVNPNYLFVIVIAAQLPDWIEAPFLMYNLNVPPFSWMYQISHKLQSRMQLPWGLVTQIVSVGAIVFLSLWQTPTGNYLASLIRV